MFSLAVGLMKRKSCLLPVPWTDKVRTVPIFEGMTFRHEPDLLENEIYCSLSKLLHKIQKNKYPLGTTMRPHLELKLTDKQIFWAGLNHFYFHFRSSFTIIYGTMHFCHF